MDNVAVSRRNTDMKVNKENAQPAYEGKSVTRRDKLSAKPFQLTNDTKDTRARSGALKAKAFPQSGETLKKVKTLQKGAASDKLHQTHSRSFIAEHIVKHPKIVAEAPSLPAARQSSKSTLGMYKGKIVQSKIGSIWKSTAALGGADPKPSASKTGGQKVRNVTKSRSTSVTDLFVHSTRKPEQTRSKSVMDGAPQVSKPAVSRAGFHSARPPATTLPTTLASASSRNVRVAPTKGSGIQSSKILVTNKQVDKPAVSSALSQYRFTIETAEEKRAKLAAWQASKGKTFKRPAMTEPAKARVSSKPDVELNPQPQPRLEAREPDSEGAVLNTRSRTPAFMNTTLDLLETSDDDLQDNVDDIVVNLCDALEAMATPSRSDDLSQVTDVRGDVVMDDCKTQHECEGERTEMSEDVEQVKDEVEESDEGETDIKCVKETVPQMENASVIKYSVKTTPYLQRVKKTIDEEASTSRSRRQSNIKDLKFLTPVRRSCRIERKASRLPPMLVDPDPCVSSLAELLKLDDDHNAYVYRKNHALPDGVPDQTERGSVNV